VNEDRTIRLMTPPVLRLVHASGLTLFLGLLSIATILNLRPTLTRNVVSYVLKDARAFYTRIVDGAREWMAQGHEVELIYLAVIFLMAVAIRLYFLTQPMGYDESITVARFSSRPLLDIVSDYSIPNNH